MPQHISARLLADTIKFRTQYRAQTPVGATPEGVERALDLCALKCQRKGNKSDPEAADPNLQSLLEVDKKDPLYQLYKQRLGPPEKKSRLRNKAFLIALILEGEGHSSSIPPAWQVPEDKLPAAGSKLSCPDGGSLDEVADGYDLSSKNSLSKDLKAKTWLRWHPALHISLWIQDHTDPDTTDAQRREHQRKYHAQLKPTDGKGPNSDTRTMLNMYERWCGEGGVRPLASLEMFEDFLVHAANHLKTLKKGFDKFSLYRERAQVLARYHGWLPRDFSYKQSEQASVHLPRMLKAAQTHLAKHVSNAPINQEDAAFTDQEMRTFLTHLMDIACSADIASTLLYFGVAIQSLSRPGQLCEVLRKDISMYPNQEMHEVADFGPIKMLGVSTVGFKQNEQAQVTHWVQRTRQPQLQDPVFAMAMKAALDSSQTWHGLSGDLLVNMEEEHIGTIVYIDDHDELVREKVPLWKIQPLMSAPGLWQTRAVDYSTNPFKRTDTPRLIDIIAKVLKGMQKDAQHIGRKTLLVREAGFVKPVLKGVREELITVTSKHSGGQVVRGHYIFKVPDTEVTMVAGGFADGIHFSDFRWQHHYTQGRQLMTTDHIRQVCPPEIWQAISAGIFPELDRLKAHLDSIQFRRLTQAEQELQAQVNLHWYLREVILQDSCFLYPKFINSRLWRDIELFSDPDSPFMMWLKETLTPAVQKLQQQADRVHDSIIRAPLGQSILDQARTALGIRQATTTAHSRQLLAKMIDLLDAQQLGGPTQEPEQEPQPACAPVSIKPQFMHVMPKDVTCQGIGLMPLWHHWGRHLRRYYLPAYAAPSHPILHRLPFRNQGERDRFNDYKEMLLEVDRQVEDAWRVGKVKDDTKKPIRTPPENLTLNDLNGKWISEAGLYELTSSSKLPAATAFKKWVFGEVLPSIRRTGSYSVQTAAPTTRQSDAWLDKRMEGKELMKLKNATLKDLIAGGFGQTGPKLYRILGNHINQAVLGFTETTTQFKKQQQLPGSISIPDVLNMQGQVARCYAETCFQKFVSDNLQRLRGLTEPDLIKEFASLKLNLRQGFVSTGMGDLQAKMLTLEEAKKRRDEISSQAKRQRLLSQAEQPKAI